MNTASNLYRELDKSEIALIIEAHFGKNDEFEYAPLSDGLFNTTYLIKLLPEGKRMVLRVGPVNRHLLLPFEENLMNSEKYVYELCTEKNIPVSNVLVCDTTKSIINRDYMFVEYIESKVLSKANVSEQAKKKLYRETGHYAARMHEITGDKFGRISEILRGKGFCRWSEYLKSEISGWEEKAIPANIYSKDDIKNIDSIFDNYSGLLDEIKVPHLVHADLWAGNVLVGCVGSNYEVKAIIDADRAVFGDVDFEFASLWMINGAFIDGYGKKLNLEEKHIVRRKIYQLIYNLLDSYICLVQYNNIENSDSNKKAALRLIHELTE